MVSHGIGSEKATILIMGASGDLTARKLIPALYVLWTGGFLDPETQIIGIARREKTDELFRDEMKEAVAQRAREEFSEATWNEFAQRVSYFQLDLMTPAGYSALSQRQK